MIYLLLVILAIIFVLNLYLNNKDFGAPAVIFSMSFLFSALWGCAFQSMWGTDIDFSTVAVVTLYVVIFSFICLITKYLFAKGKEKEENQNCYDEPLDLNSGVMKLILILFLIMTVVYIRVLMSRIGASTILQTIGGTYSTRLETLNIPFYLRLYIALAQGVGYWISYVFIRNIFFKKLEITALLLFAVCFLSNLLSGSRGVAVCMILSFPANILLQSYRNNKYARKISIKKILLVIVIVLLGLWIFANSERWLGRATVSSWNAIDSLGAYCGAEIYNLNSFLKNAKIPQSNQFGALTFSSLLNTISKYLGINYTRPTAYSFVHVNGHFMGNVFTMLYEPLYDFGYLGCTVLIIFYALLSQVTYNSATNSVSNNRVPFSVNFYGYLYPLLAVSFFAWWFGNYVVSTAFIYIVISWELCNYFVLKVRFTFKGRPIR